MLTNFETSTGLLRSYLLCVETNSSRSRLGDELMAARSWLQRVSQRDLTLPSRTSPRSACISSSSPDLATFRPGSSSSLCQPRRADWILSTRALLWLFLFFFDACLDSRTLIISGEARVGGREKNK